MSTKKLPPEVLEFFRKQGARGGKKAAANLTAEERAERSRKGSAALTPEQRAERARTAALRSVEVRRAKAEERKRLAESPPAEAGAAKQTKKRPAQ